MDWCSSRCLPGSFANETGTIECLPCAAGTFQIADGRSECELCGAGKFSLTRQATCSDCNGGTMQPHHGKSSCVTCPASSNSDTLRQLCECGVGFYATTSDGTSAVCPHARGTPTFRSSLIRCNFRRLVSCVQSLWRVHRARTV